MPGSREENYPRILPSLCELSDPLYLSKALGSRDNLKTDMMGEGASLRGDSDSPLQGSKVLSQ